MGQLGSTTNVLDTKPKRKPQLLSPSVFFNDLKITQIECGKHFTIALSEKGSIFSWGQGSRGELGLGSRINVLKPTLIRAINKIKRISAGSHHAAAVSENGNLYMWGYGKYGRHEFSRNFCIFFWNFFVFFLRKFLNFNINFINF